MKTSQKLSTFAGGIAAFCLSGLMLFAAEPTENCWPFTVGNTWTVETKVNDKSITQVLTVTKVTPGEAGASDATIEYKVGDNVVQTEIYRFDAKGITRVSSGASGGNTITPPIPVVQYPMVAGKKWSWKGTVKSGDQEMQATADFSTSGPELLKLASGEFQAMRVHSNLVVTQPGGEKAEFPNDYWFAPGVGMVQQSAKFGDIFVKGELTSYKVK